MSHDERAVALTQQAEDYLARRKAARNLSAVDNIQMDDVAQLNLDQIASRPVHIKAMLIRAIEERDEARSAARRLRTIIARTLASERKLVALIQEMMRDTTKEVGHD